MGFNAQAFVGAACTAIAFHSSALGTQRADGFLVHRGDAYVAGPVYSVVQATADVRFAWSNDARRLAFVTYASGKSPRTTAALLAKGSSARGMTRLGVWSADTGIVRDVLTSTDPTEGVDQFEFLGRDLVFTTFSTGKPRALWIARDGLRPVPVELPEEALADVRFAAARKRAAILLASDKGLWLMNSESTRKLDLGSLHGIVLRTVNSEDEALAMTEDAAGSIQWISVNLGSGTIRRLNDGSAEQEAQPRSIFAAQTYRLGGVSTDSLFPAPKAKSTGPAFVAQEDGGYRIDLVEVEGEKPRKISFIHETGDMIEVSQDGLSFAFVSNGMIMVRSLVKLEAAASKKLINAGQGGS